MSSAEKLEKSQPAKVGQTSGQGESREKPTQPRWRSRGEFYCIMWARRLRAKAIRDQEIKNRPGISQESP